MNSARPLWGLLLSPWGRLERSAFLWTAGILVVLKISADYCLARFIFHEPWSPAEYVWSKSLFLRLSEQRSLDFYFTRLCLAAPFAWMGASLCAKRLRSAGAPVWLVFFFFVPLAKWFFFALLSVLPQRPPNEGSSEEPAGAGFGWLPQSAAGSACAAIAITTALGTGIVLITAKLFAAYGSTLFLATPFLTGFLATILHGARRDRTLGQSVLPALLSLVFIGAILLAVAAEGAVCLIMAAPLAVCEALAGSFIAHGILQGLHRPPGQTLSCGLVLPLLFVTEKFAPSPPIVRSVTTEIIVNAPPEQVWTQVISFPEIPPPHEWIFRAGIACPERAKIDGAGVGAIRHCVFSTGEFVEPITEWNPPFKLGFAVSAQPDSLKELSPYGELRTPHLRGYFESKRGEFRLWPMTAGKTRLQGTTWYTLKFAPESYWQLWSDYLIHRIHLRVLQHIKQQTETQARQGRFTEPPTRGGPMETRDWGQLPLPVAQSD